VLEAWTAGREVHLSGTGHNIRREAFEEYLSALREFLAEVF
jgi:hypothetical protein